MIYLYSYIKELADRLNTLEGAMQAGEIPQFTSLHHEGGSRPGSNEYSPPPNMDQRKRTFSSISNEFSSPAYQAQRPSVGWSSAEASRQLPPPNYSGDQAQSGFRTHYSPNGLAPQAVWSNAPDTLRTNASFGSMGQADQSYPDHKVDWDDSLING
jgi:hypothetical protein